MLEACNVQGILLNLNSANFMHTFIYMYIKSEILAQQHACMLILL